MDPIREFELVMSRRQLFGKAAFGVGTAALHTLLRGGGLGAGILAAADAFGTGPQIPTKMAPKAKCIIMLFMNGGPSQLDLFDYKPKMEEEYDKDLPETIRNGQRLTTMTSGQTRFPIAPSKFKFTKHMSYGLGSLNQNLPTYVVLHSKVGNGKMDQALFSRLWGTGFLPGEHQGVSLRSAGDPVLYLKDPNGIDSKTRRAMLDDVSKINHMQLNEFGDPEIEARIKQYEMAYKMQASVPELMDLSKEKEETFELYGPDSKVPGTFAANCLLARRMVQRGVRFIQIFHRGWDQHSNLTGDLPSQCKDVDQACAGLIKDLKRLGMLDETLVVWGGEFGRTVYCQGALSRANYGRDHHPRSFTRWMAGGGVKPGISYGQTDDYGYNIVDKDGNVINPSVDDFTPGAVHIHDLNATMMHLVGIDHTKLTYRYQGRDFRLTDVHGHVVKDLIK